MEILIIAAVLIVGIVIVYFFKGKEKKDESVEQKDEKHTEKEFEPDTFGLMNDILGKIGCPTKKNDDGTLSVCYQGDCFLMEFKRVYARIWYIKWASLEVDDYEYPLIYQAMNEANCTMVPTVVLSDRDEEGKNWFYSRIDVLLHPSCPDNEVYVKAIFKSLFNSKRTVQRSLDKLKSEQMENFKIFSESN